MKIIQKTIFILCLLTTSVFFVYALSFSTGWALGQWFGQFFTDAQVFNKLIFKWALGGVVLSGVALVVANHSNRRFYVQNYLLSGAIVYVLFRSSLILWEYIPNLKLQYEAIPEMYLIITTSINFSQISTFVFDFGMVYAYVLMVMAVLIVLATVAKTIDQSLKRRTRRARLEAEQ